ncbi:MAG: alpha-galactosidase [Streptococcus sp.]|nr:alpha-galactosidase [Streptococcus sp.]
MGIKIEQHLFYINSKDFGMIIEERDGYLLLKHLGRRIDTYHFSNALFEQDHAFSGNPTSDNRTFSLDTQRQIIGQHGLGDFRQPSIQIQHDNNEVTDFRFVKAEILKQIVEAEGLPNPHDDENAETLALILEDSVAKLRLTLYYTVYFEQNTISSFTRLENLGSKPVIIHKMLSFMADVPIGNYDILTFQGSYAREKELVRSSVEQGFFKVSSNRGASGHAQTPSLILCDKETGEDFGEAFACQLLYSGNFQVWVQKNQFKEIRVGIGLNDENFSWELLGGQRFDSPVSLLTYSYQGLTNLTQESQSFIQDHIIPKRFSQKERPILINNWEATYFNFTKEKLVSLADEAKKLGIELFVLDDGWFGNRFDDNRSLGDWYVNEEKLEGGLADLIEQMHSKGLQFGLWIEPEMVSEDSQLYRAHPDWAIQVPGRKHTYSRNQLVLDYSNPQVVSYIKKRLASLLSDYQIDYVKWDMNRNITKIGNGETYIQTKMQSHRYILGLYQVITYLTEKHPEVLFESCSGGGGRNDLGMLSYFPQVWTSDNTDAIARLSIQYGSSYLYPSISMGAHVSAVPNHQMGRITPLETRGHVAMMGNLGYELDLTQLSLEEKNEIAQQVKFYKEIRPIVQFGQQYRLLNPEVGSNEVALQFKYENKLLVTYVRIQSTVEIMETSLKLKDLDVEGLYQLQENGKIYSGAELMYAGLTIVLPAGDYRSKQLYFIKQN